MYTYRGFSATSLHNTTDNSRSLFTYFAFIGFAYLLSFLFVYTHRMWGSFFDCDWGK